MMNIHQRKLPTNLEDDMKVGYNLKNIKHGKATNLKQFLSFN